MGRQLKMVFFGSPRHEAAEHASESTPLMTVPLMILAVLAIVGGLLNFPHFGATSAEAIEQPGVLERMDGSDAGDPADRKVRDEARRTLEDHMKTFQTNDARVRDYRLLRGLRNHFAHGNRAENSEAERVAGSAESVRAELRRVIASLLPDVR
jgi:hypothetical protein